MLNLLLRVYLFVTSLFINADGNNPKVAQPATITNMKPLVYDKDQGKWIPVTSFETSTTPKKLRIATHNVLKVVGWLLEFVVRSNERFAKEMVVLKNLDADIIGLNEVTPPFLELLQEQDWVRDNYYLSDGLATKTTSVNGSIVFSKSEMGNIILSKVPFKSLRSFSFSSTASCQRNVIIGTFFDSDLVICSAHITAYEQYFKRRETQMKELVEDLPEKNTIILGDLNLHLISENKLITDIGYEDLWQPTEEDQDGFTWDTKLNLMITKFLILDRRRMRLDRIIAKNGCEWKTDEKGVNMFATEPVYKDSYLTCSDHFGLCADLINTQ
jgi:poly(A) polymerase